MAWYRVGLVTVTNGSGIVTGAGTDFVSNTQQGEGFLGPDGRVYEIGQIISATQLALVGNYQGASAGGQSYALLPTSSFARDLALGAAELLNTFATVRDGIGQGLISDGTPASPGIRFAVDQDTGIARLGSNYFGLIAGGSVGATLDAANVFTVSSLFSPNRANMGYVTIKNPGGASNEGGLTLSSASSAKSWVMQAGIPAISNDHFSLYDVAQARTVFAIDPADNVLFNANGGRGGHYVNRYGAGEGGIIIDFDGGGGAYSATLYGVAGQGGNISACAVNVGRHSSTNRSINAGGTINASGADYAEYMTKADGCGSIEKGDVCGVDQDGLLTRTWANAVSYVVKSTDPSYVGGDVWAAHLAPEPEWYGSEPLPPPAAPEMPDTDDTEALSMWRVAAQDNAHAAAAFPTKHAAWEDAKQAYETAVAHQAVELEKARVCVDRIAFCGQVPVNVTDAFAVGDYVIAAANGAGIKAVAVKEADITFDQYRRRLGKIWAVREGRAWIDVQHG